jgi:hypothetical protein
LRQIPRPRAIEGVKRASPLRRASPSTLRPIHYSRFSLTWGCYPIEVDLTESEQVEVVHQETGHEHNSPAGPEDGMEDRVTGLESCQRT